MTLFHNYHVMALILRNVNGMWAFIFGDLKKSIYFSRDRYGKKPLYFLMMNIGQLLV